MVPTAPDARPSCAVIARILEQSLWVVASVRGNGIFAAETKPPKPFIEIQLAICGEKGSHQATPLLRALCEKRAVDQCSELAADNGLVRSSSPPSLRWRLITAWLEVRVFSAPPRSLAQTEISRLVANSPELAGIRAPILSLQAVDWISRVVLALLSLPRKIAFPGNGDRQGTLLLERK
jgi:hypothetical protein